jgi:hypothetical protein
MLRLGAAEIAGRADRLGAIEPMIADLVLVCAIHSLTSRTSGTARSSSGPAVDVPQHLYAALRVRHPVPAVRPSISRRSRSP